MLQKMDSNTELKSGHWLVTSTCLKTQTMSSDMIRTLVTIKGEYLDWHTVVQLYPRNSPELHGKTKAIAQPEVLGHVLKVPAHVTRQPEVAEVASCQEHVSLKVISEASHLGPKR